MAQQTPTQGPIQIPLTVNVEARHDIRSTHGGFSYDAEVTSFIKNGLVEKDPINGTIYVRRRPGFKKIGTLDSSRTITALHGFEYIQKTKKFAVAYRDDTAGNSYIDYDGTGYVLTGSPGLNNRVEMTYITSGGVDYIFIVYCRTQLGTNVGFAWVFNTATTTVTQLTTATHGFPESTEVMSRGAVWFDNYAFVLTQTGKIYNSNVGDVLTWTSTDYLTAGDTEDKKVYLAQHHNTLVVAGTKYIHFYDDVGNPNGSPLGLRKDLTIPIGVLSSSGTNVRYSNSIAHDDEYIAFAGTTGDSSLEFTGGASTGVYLIQNFSVKKISTPAIDILIDRAEARNTVTPQVSIIQVSGRKFITLSANSPSKGFTIEGSLVYDIEYNIWYVWTYGSLVDLGAIHSSGSFILGSTQGDAIMEIRTSYAKDEEYNHSTSTTTTSIFPFTIQTPQTTLSTSNNKLCRNTTLIGDYTAGQENVEISWTDDNYQNFSTVRTYDLQYHRKLTRCGSFRKRAWKIHQDSTTTGSRYPVRLSHIEINVDPTYVNVMD